MKLPVTNHLGYYEIRFESIGGMGANLAGKMLAEAGLKKAGLNVLNFSSYGSEKKGTPVKTFVRFSEPEIEILDNSPVENPHLLVIFHEAMLNSPTAAAGLLKGGIAIVNSKKQPEQLREKLGLAEGRVVTVDATNIALEVKSRVNTVLLGTLAAHIGFISLDDLLAIVEDNLKKKYPHLVDANIEGMERGYSECLYKDFKDDGTVKPIPFIRPNPKYGYLDAPRGGVILEVGNSVEKDLSQSRVGVIPVLDLEKCVHCGECDITCPDYCFVWEKRQKGNKVFVFLKGIDYRYCKGCLKCVEICKPKALTAAKEDGVDIEKITISFVERYGAKSSN